MSDLRREHKSLRVIRHRPSGEDDAMEQDSECILWHSEDTTHMIEGTTDRWSVNRQGDVRHTYGAYCEGMLTWLFLERKIPRIPPAHPKSEVSIATHEGAQLTYRGYQGSFDRHRK